MRKKKMSETGMGNNKDMKQKIGGWNAPGSKWRDEE